MSAIILAALLTGCGNEDKGSGTGHQYKAVLCGNPESLDPQFADDPSSNTVIKNLYSGLMSVDAGGGIVCCNAESYTVSADGTAYTFTLRDDNYWFFDTNDNDLIEEEECVFTLTAAGYIKRMPASTYRAQKRGGKGISAQSLREEDYVETLFTASSHDNILFFTSSGRVYKKKGYQIPEASRTAKGTHLNNVFQFEPGERVTAMLHGRDYDENGYLFMVTRNGTVKRVEKAAMRNIRASGLRAITLDEDDELISVRETDGDMNILLLTHDGMAICFRETDVRPMGRTAVGVRGIKLRKGDYVIGAVRALPDKTLLIITENGFGKRTAIEEYVRAGGEPQHRGGLGLKGYQITDKTGKAAGVKAVDDTDDILLISDDGTMIRMAAADVNLYSRTAQGVKVMRVAEGSKVIALARVEKVEEETMGSEDEEMDETTPDNGGTEA